MNSKGKFTKEIKETMEMVGLLAPGMNEKNQETLRIFLRLQFVLTFGNGKIAGMDRAEEIHKEVREEMEKKDNA